MEDNNNFPKDLPVEEEQTTEKKENNNKQSNKNKKMSENPKKTTVTQQENSKTQDIPLNPIKKKHGPLKLTNKNKKKRK